MSRCIVRFPSVMSVVAVKTRRSSACAVLSMICAQRRACCCATRHRATDANPVPASEAGHSDLAAAAVHDELRSLSGGQVRLGAALDGLRSAQAHCCAGCLRGERQLVGGFIATWRSCSSGTTSQPSGSGFQDMMQIIRPACQNDRMDVIAPDPHRDNIVQNEHLFCPPLKRGRGGTAHVRPKWSIDVLITTKMVIIHMTSIERS